MFEKFATVLDDDFLFVTGASSDQLNDESNTPLAAYTGSLPTPFAVRFDVEALRLNFVTKRNNRDAGFRVRYDANACDDDKNDNKKVVKNTIAQKKNAKNAFLPLRVMGFFF